MSAAEALMAARAAGVRLGLDGKNLTLEAAGAPPPAVLDLLSRHKAGIVALLRPANDGWSAEDWLAFFDRAVVNDTGIDGPGQVAGGLGYVLRYMQTGKLPNYALAMVIGVVVIAVVGFTVKG